MIHPFGMTGFCLLTALSTRNDEPTRASRPFDRLRDGFVLGEGAAMLVVEELEFAKKRGAHIWGEVLGYGSTSDAYRITDIHPEARALLDGSPVDDDTVVRTGQSLTFVRPSGEKGWPGAWSN